MDKTTWTKKKIALRKLYNKILEMPESERAIYRNTIKQNIMNLKLDKTAEIRKNKEIMSIPEERTMSDTETDVFIIAHIVAGIISAIGLECMAIGVDSVTLADVLLTAIGGAFSGLVVSGFNALCYKNKPISNAIKNFRIYLSDKKVGKIDDKIKSDEYLIGLMEEPQI